jgi:hypothetical protein
MESIERMKNEIAQGLSPLDGILGAQLMEGFLEKTGDLSNFSSRLALSVGMAGVNSQSIQSFLWPPRFGICMKERELVGSISC